MTIITSHLLQAFLLLLKDEIATSARGGLTMTGTILSGVPAAPPECWGAGWTWLQRAWAEALDP